MRIDSQLSPCCQNGSNSREEDGETITRECPLGNFDGRVQESSFLTTPWSPAPSPSIYPLSHFTPRRRDEKALLHIPNHPDELILRHRKSEDIFGDARPGRDVEHPKDAPRTRGALFEIRILHHGAATSGKGRKNPTLFDLIEIGEGKKARENVRPSEEDHYLGIL